MKQKSDMPFVELVDAAKAALAGEKESAATVGASFLMRKFNLGWIRAQELIGELQHAGALGPINAEGKFEIL